MRPTNFNRKNSITVKLTQTTKGTREMNYGQSKTKLNILGDKTNHYYQSTPKTLLKSSGTYNIKKEYSSPLKFIKTLHQGTPSKQTPSATKRSRYPLTTYTTVKASTNLSPSNYSSPIKKNIHYKSFMQRTYSKASIRTSGLKTNSLLGEASLQGPPPPPTTVAYVTKENSIYGSDEKKKKAKSFYDFGHKSGNRGGEGVITKLNKNGLLGEFNLKKFKEEDFEFGKKLGKGKFGHVFLARDKKTNFLVAIKVMEKVAIVNMKSEKQVVREIKIHSYLNHENIIQLYGVFHDENYIYLILEYSPGGEVYKELKASVSHFLTFSRTEDSAKKSPPNTSNKS
jgi:hypothetical protein